MAAGGGVCAYLNRRVTFDSVKTRIRQLAPLLAASFLAIPLLAQTESRQATYTIRGSRDWDKCTIEVVVDGSADVEIRGNTALLRTLSGMPAAWRRFECSGPLTAYPGEFKFSGIDGRGNQRLVQEPGNGRGTAIIRIEDPRPGTEGYTFDIEWRGGGNSPSPGQIGGPPGRIGNPGGTQPPAARRDLGRVVSLCQRAVEERAAREGIAGLVIESLQADIRPGQNNWIAGAASAQQGRGPRGAAYNFSCSVNFDTGVIYSVELNRR